MLVAVESAASVADVVPNAALLPPNLKPPPKLEASVLELSVDVEVAVVEDEDVDVPNLKPPDELLVEDEEASIGVAVALLLPNLKPPEDESLEAPPNLKPPAASEVEVPNLKPPEGVLEVSESDPPNLIPLDELSPVLAPNLNPPVLETEGVEPNAALGSVLAPGLLLWQATHCMSSALFDTQHTSHSQLPAGFLNLSPKPSRGAAEALDEESGGRDVDIAPDFPGFALWQATHLVSCALFWTMQVSHSHEPSGFLNLSPNPSDPAEEVDIITGASSKPEAVEEELKGVEMELLESVGKVRPGLTPVPGLAVSQATHLSASGLFCTRQVSHSQVPAGGANAARPRLEDEEAVETAGVLLSNWGVDKEKGETLSVWGLGL